MSDDDRIRSLLTIAADLPDDVQPPVASLLERSRRRRRLRAAGTIAGVLAVAAAAFAIPASLRSLGPGPLPVGPRYTPPAGTQHPTGPTAVQLTKYRWSALASSPLGPRSQPLLAWSGRYLIELGGISKGTARTDGAAYDTATGRWQRIAPVKANVGFSDAVSAWTGRQLFVASSLESSCLAIPGHPAQEAACLPHAGLYDPAANRWTTTPLPGKLWGLTLEGAAWTGRDIIVAGTASNVRHARLAVAAYDTATGHWTMITPRLPAGHLPVGLAMVATGDRVLLWSLWSKTTKHSPTSFSVASGIDVLALGPSGTWTTATTTWPQRKTVDSPVYAGGTIFLAPSQIWCGLCSHPGIEFPARLVSPVTFASRSIPSGPLAPHPTVQADLWLWTGRTAIAANEQVPSWAPAGYPPSISKLAAYSPATHQWHILPRPPAAPLAATPIWATRQLLLLTSSGSLFSLKS